MKYCTKKQQTLFRIKLLIKFVKTQKITKRRFKIVINIHVELHLPLKALKAQLNRKIYLAMEINSFFQSNDLVDV